jgi:hypothetical protein
MSDKAYAESRRGIGSRDWAYALILAILAALPRLYRLGLAEFKLDEANHYRMAYFLTRGTWRWVGSTSSIGLPKPPLFVYALALPLSISRDPRVAIGFLGVLAALACGLFYLSLRHWLGRKAAWSAALLFAFNPQAVLYARKLFTADLLPSLCAVFFAVGLAFLGHSPRKAGRLSWLVTFTFGLLILTTFSPLILLPALAFLFFERRRDLRPQHWVGAAAALALPLTPYLAKVAGRIPSVLTVAGGTPATPLPVLRWIWTLLHGSPWPTTLFSRSGIAAGLVLILSVAGLWLLVSEARSRVRGRWARFSLAWLGLSPLLALVLPVQLHPHYFVVLYPLLFVLPAAGVELAARRARLLGWVAFLMVGALVVWQGWTWSETLRAVDAGVRGYGTPLGYWWRAAERARTLTEQENAAEVLLLMPGDDPWDQKASVLGALLSATPHRVVDGRTAIVYPPHPTVFLAASEVEKAVSLTTPCTRDLSADLKASPWGGEYRYRLWSPTGGASSACKPMLAPATATWASGARLLGYTVQGTARPGETLAVMLFWETMQGPFEADVHWFTHLQDEAGQRWGQHDAVGWPATRWQPGDRVLFHFDLAIAPDAEAGPYVLRVGQYTYPEIENIPVLDEAGNPADYSATLPVPRR